MTYLGNTPTTQSFISGTDYFNGTGSQTAFTLSRTVASINDIQVTVNNVVQQPNDAYTISGTTLTMTSAPSSGTNNVYVRYLSTTTQAITPSQNTVSYSTLNSDNQSKLGIDFKNRIINGNMVIDQRYAGAATANTISGYTLDRWNVAQTTTGKLIVQQNAGSVTPPAGFTNYLGVTSQSAYSIGAGDFYAVLQSIEGYNLADLNWGTANAKTITLSFWVRSSLTGTFGLCLNNGGTRSYPFTYTISSANTWEQKSITVAGDQSGTWNATNGTGVQIWFGLGVGSTNAGPVGAWASANYVGVSSAVSVVGTNGATFYITGVQLEVGTQATTFTTAGGSYGAELALCQRYYQRSYDIGTATGTSFNANYEIPAYFIGTGNYGFVCSKTFLTSMRGTPTITVYSDDGIAGRVTPWNSSSVAIASVNAIQNGITAGNFNNNTSVGVVYGFAFTASAEL
jgi:hypothetical protein